MKLFAASRIRSLKNPRAASTDAKDKRGVEISVAWKNQPNPNQKEEERDESQIKESDNDDFF